MLTVTEGSFLVKSARCAIEKEFRGDIEIPSPPKSLLGKSNGVFVTLKKSGELRGCIGFISPVPLYSGVQEAAKEAAFNDPRFDPVTEDEVSDLTIEVSVMGDNVRIPNRKLDSVLEEIEIGRDGLFVSDGVCSGLLLPQVPVEQGWSKEEFLRGICEKSGIPYESLTDKGTSIYRFKCQVFSESSPSGNVEMKNFKSNLL